MSERAERGRSRAWPMADRSVLATVLGVETWAAVGIAAGLTALGVCVDLLRIGTLGPIFTVCYVAGCLIAVVWVRRDGLFWPVVLPPLLAAVAVPAVVLLAGSPRTGTGMAERLLVIAAPLVNAFPIMAWTCGLVLAAGLIRTFTQRLGRPRSGSTTPAAGQRKRVSSRRGPAADGAPEATRTSGSPPRS